MNCQQFSLKKLPIVGHQIYDSFRLNIINIKNHLVVGFDKTNILQIKVE
jgi:hypothetical protein